LELGGRGVGIERREDISERTIYREAERGEEKREGRT